MFGYNVCRYSLVSTVLFARVGMPNSSSPNPVTLAVRPTATKISSNGMRTSAPLCSHTSTFSPFSTTTCFALWPVNTATPSFSKDLATSADTSGSSRMRMRGSISTCDTLAPKRAKHCVNSEPMGPPPSTTKRFGRSRKFQTVSLVKNPASAKPGIGGTNGRAPVAMTMFFAVNVCFDPSELVTSTAHGETMRALPVKHSTPKPV